MMKCLQIGNAWFTEKAGGLDRMFAGFIQHLPAVGVSARGLVVGSDQVTVETQGTVQAYAPFNAPLPTRLWHARRAVQRTLQTANIDLVAAHFALYAAPALDHLAGRPFVMHFHGPWAAEVGVEGGTGLRRSMQVMLERRVYHRADRLIVLSEAFKRELIKGYGVSEERVRVVPGGIDPALFDCGLDREAARQRLDWPQDRPIVLAVRRLVRRMGLEDLLEATQSMVRRVPDILVLIGGRGPLTEELQHRIDELGLRHHVRLLGFIPDEQLPIAYRAANISVVPTVALEGFGLITLESLASGTPVLVTPVGGLPEVVTALSPQLVLESTGPNALSMGICDALLGERVLPSAEQCQAYVAEHFAWARVAERVSGVYNEALG